MASSQKIHFAGVVPVATPDTVLPDPRLQDGVGCWLERLSSDVRPNRPALFLDRDGVIVEETHYLSDAASVRLIDGAAKAIARANAAGVSVIVVTNQAGIARGYYSWRDFDAVQTELTRRLAAAGAHLDLVLACAYHDTGKAPYRLTNHPWRKPNPGMIQSAAQLFAVNLSQSVLVGDKISDLAAGLDARLARVVLVRTGHGQSEEAALHRAALDPTTAITVASDLAAAVADSLPILTGSE